ncbi:MAG: SpoIIIAH-like family protein [Oscillospiraceae bacterium]|nr:SpoIIIAH-like family protein [Oscillospiraceae bacterium]
MKLWKRNIVVAVIVLFVCAAVYLNWFYGQEVEAGTEASESKLLGEATLVSGEDDEDGGDAQDSGGGESAEDSEDTEDGESTETGYFSSARLNRQQARDSALSLLQDAAADEAADQTMIDAANASIQAMAASTLLEAQIENLITAKGYQDCICFIGDESITVVVASVEGGLTDVDTARISDIVVEETGLSVSDVTIVEADP